MNTTDQCCYRHTESQFSMRRVSNYYALLFLVLALSASSWFIQHASAQQIRGTLELVGPSADPSPDEEFVVSVKIMNPENVLVFNMYIEYPDVLSLNGIEPGVDQFDIDHLSIGDKVDRGGGRVQRYLNLRNNTDDISAGIFFTIKFEASESGHHQIEITEANLYDLNGELNLSDIPILRVAVREPLQGTVKLVPPIGSERLGETGFIDIELTDRSRAHRYEITVDPSENLGALTVSYNADDKNGTAITNHTAGDPITVRADLWLPNDPIDNIIDWRVTHSDPIVATLFFTPTDIGEGSLEITEAKIFDADNTVLTHTNPDTLTFTIAGERTNVVQRNTGVGPTPIIEVDSGVKNGPFEIMIYFQSENYIEQQHQRLENGEVVEVIATFKFQRGVYGFWREEIEVGGTAGASVTTRLWEADGAQIYYARINPTVAGTREVTIQIPAGVVLEVGTNLPNVASEIVTVSTNLTNPPWDVSNNGVVEEADAEFVEEALGQGLEDRGNFALYINTIEDPRTDVNGDLYVNHVDVDLVRKHITPEGGAQGDSDDVRGQSDETRQARSIASEPDASVWMPDVKLRQCVRKKLKLANDTELTQTGMENLSRLSCRNKGISDITGLEYATNLKWLDFKSNNITDLTPLQGLTKLTYLNIKENQISNIAPLSNLTKLTELWMTSNNIQDISPLSNLVKLRVLRISDNPILDLSPLYPLIQGKLKWYGGLDVPRYPPWDVNQDGSVNSTDVTLVTAALGQTGDNILSPRMDVNSDGTVDNADLTLVTDNLETDGGAPSNVSVFDLLDQKMLESLDRKVLEGYLNVLRAESDGSAKYQRAIAMLERILAALRPMETLLLTNYPNPFNPETWIPYHLANASDVRITIYDVRGQVIRRLDLGHQLEGYYTSLSRAAHWDGRNDLGERVGSGIYFYQLQTDNASHLSKMVILK